MGISRRLVLAAIALTPAVAGATGALAARPAPKGLIKPRNELERRIDELAHRKTPAARKAFEECFLRSDLYLVTTPGGMETAMRGAKQGAAIAIWQGPLADGRHCVALFTSEARMRESFYEEDEVPYVTMSGRDTLDLAVGGPLVINYGLQPPVFIEPDQAKAMQALA